MFSIVSVPPIVQRAANSPYSHQHLLFSVFDRNHHNECEVVSHCTLGLRFPKHWRRRWHPTPVLLPGKSHGRRSLVGCSPWGRWESDTTELLHFHFHFHALEKEMATHSSVLAWRIPGTGEPDGLPSMGSHRVGHD